MDKKRCRELNSMQVALCTTCFLSSRMRVFSKSRDLLLPTPSIEIGSQLPVYGCELQWYKNPGIPQPQYTNSKPRTCHTGDDGHRTFTQVLQANLLRKTIY